MSLSVFIPANKEFDFSLIPDCIKDDYIESEQEGFDYGCLLLIFQSFSSAIQDVANITAIVSFIIVLLQMYDAEVTISGKNIPKSYSEEEVKKLIQEYIDAHKTEE